LAQHALDVSSLRAGMQQADTQFDPLKDVPSNALRSGRTGEPSLRAIF
jgi:hypothetical protein